MRWGRGHRPAPEPTAIPMGSPEPGELEVIEIDAEGRLVSPAPRPRHDSIPQVAYERGDDPGSLAGIWEALGRS